MQNTIKSSQDQIISTADISQLIRNQIRLRIKRFGMKIGSRALVSMIGSSLSIGLKGKGKPKK